MCQESKHPADPVSRSGPDAAEAGLPLAAWPLFEHPQEPGVIVPKNCAAAFGKSGRLLRKLPPGAGLDPAQKRAGRPTAVRLRQDHGRYSGHNAWAKVKGGRAQFQAYLGNAERGTCVHATAALRNSLVPGRSLSSGMSWIAGMGMGIQGPCFSGSECLGSTPSGRRRT